MLKRKPIRVPTTGVTKLTKLSVSSCLNHLTDISSFQQCSTLIGINFNPKKRNIDMPIVEPA